MHAEKFQFQRDIKNSFPKEKQSGPRWFPPPSVTWGLDVRAGSWSESPDPQAEQESSELTHHEENGNKVGMNLSIPNSKTK